jgi:hypothetical protein
LLAAERGHARAEHGRPDLGRQQWRRRHDGLRDGRGAGAGVLGGTTAGGASGSVVGATGSGQATGGEAGAAAGGSGSSGSSGAGGKGSGGQRDEALQG